MAVLNSIKPSRATRNFRGRFNQDQDLYTLDIEKTPKRNACDIFRALCSQSGVLYDIASQKVASTPSGSTADTTKSLSKTIVSDARRLSYLNALVELLSAEESRLKIGFTTEELLCCLRTSLVHEATQVRTAALRAVRYVLRTEVDVIAFNSLRLPYLVTRCMDVVLQNEMERVQALRVIRRALRLGASRCEASIARALVAVPDAAPEDRDRMMRACLAALCELGVLNPTLFIQAGGVGAITRAILDCQTPRIAESLCGVLLHLLNDPRTRAAAKVDLRCLAAPYCDFHYRHGWMDKNRDERDLRFTCSRLSLLSILRSWPGMLHFCDPMNQSGLKAIVAVLYLNQLEVRKAVLELLYELIGLTQPEWTDELSVALAAVDPSDFQNSWGLNDGFVAEEGRSILPHLAATGPNLIELHLAVLLYCFLEVGLLDGLVEVMVTSDTYISVRATVLLGQLLHLIHLLLPPEVCNISPALPTLLSRASATHPQALAAVSALQNLNSLLKSRPASSSLFLDHILQYCDSATYDRAISADDNITKLTSIKAKIEPSRGPHKYPDDCFDLLNDDDFELEQSHRRSSASRNEQATKNEAALVKSKSVSAVVSKVVKIKKTFNLFETLKDSDNLIRDSSVLHDRVGFTWDWNIIRAILKQSCSWGAEQGAVVRRLVHYLLPSSRRFSHMDLPTSPQQTRDQALAALELVGYLLSLQDVEGVQLLTELFMDISRQVDAISKARSAHDCLFSPLHMTNTMCQMYFLLIGKLCSTREGLRIFRDTGLYDSLLRLCATTYHSCYVKLIISSLNYTLNSYPRQILAKTLQHGTDPSRLYATQFLNVVLRARQKANEINNRHSGGSKRGVCVDVEPPSPGGEGSSSDMDMSRTWMSVVEICAEMDAWILEMLVKQARDTFKPVALCALNILDEACNVPAYLNKLVCMKPRVRDLGDKGYLLWIRFASTQAGFQALAEPGYVQRQIRYWANHYNYRYTRLVEGDIHECLTLLQRSEDGRYSERHSSARPVCRRDAPLPPHLYSQLARHAAGVGMLAAHAQIPTLLKRLKGGLCCNEQEIIDVKSAMWACGHIASSAGGIELLAMLATPDCFIAYIVRLAETCPVYSIRGTAFYVLGLIGSTYEGANLLHQYGWLSVRHNRHDRWPIIHEENWLTKTASQDQLFENVYQTPSQTDHRITVDIETSENSDKTDHSTAESCHCDNINTKHLVASNTIEQSLTEESCDSCEGDMMDEKTDGEKMSALSGSDSWDKLGQEKKVKCLTLPQRFPGARSHQRSLSESKTADKLNTEEEAAHVDAYYDKTFYIGPISENRPLGRLFDHWHEGIKRRIRNNSESSTSGVSSCDSALGKYILNDRVPTLSPIPSSSSLTAMKSVLPSRRKSEATRRISLHSYTGSDIASSPPSHRDIVGYATLRSINFYRRPTYSETSVDELSSFLSSDVKKSTFGSLKGKSTTTQARNTRMSLLKYDWKPISAPTDVKSTSQSQVKDPGKGCGELEGGGRKGGPLPPPPGAAGGPCYSGISMPRCLLSIFPQDPPKQTHTYASDDHQKDMAAKKNDDSNFNSSFSDISTGNGVKSSSKVARSRWRERFSKHDQLTCLYCARIKPNPDTRKTSDLREAFFAGMDSPKAGGSVSGRSGVFGKSPAPTNSLTYPSLDVSCGSPTSLDSNLSKMSDAAANISEEVLKHAERMGNPVWFKQSKMALLSLKQKYPETFQSICLYSEICKLVSQSTYRLNARRFLQELFLDLNFDLFFVEPQQILQSKLSEQEESA